MISLSRSAQIIPQVLRYALLWASQMQRGRTFWFLPKVWHLIGHVALFLAGLNMSMLVNAAPATVTEQVFAAERGFAKTMADRNLVAFAGFLSDEAVFFDGAKPLRGKVQIVSGWSGYFTGARAPFSWEPDQVEVLASGTIALSTGPVRDPAGKVLARFNTIWRLEAAGTWRVVFDKGSPASAGPP